MYQGINKFMEIVLKLNYHIKIILISYLKFYEIVTEILINLIE